MSDANGWTEIQKSEIPEDFAIRLIGPADASDLAQEAAKKSLT